MQNILIIGAGPAGIEAAITLTRLGYSVTLVKKENQTNTNLRNKMLLFPDFSEASTLVRWTAICLETPLLRFLIRKFFILNRKKRVGWLQTQIKNVSCRCRFSGNRIHAIWCHTQRRIWLRHLQRCD